MATQEESRAIVVRAALIQTTGTSGWQYVKQMSNKVVQNAVQEALDEEDPTKGESKRLKAKALQKGFTDLFASIEAVKAYDPTATDDGTFGVLEIDEKGE